MTPALPNRAHSPVYEEAADINISAANRPGPRMRFGTFNSAMSMAAMTTTKTLNTANAGTMATVGTAATAMASATAMAVVVLTADAERFAVIITRRPAIRRRA